MSPVEEIREAARLMRQRAQAADEGPWLVDEDGVYTEPRWYVEEGKRFYGSRWISTEGVTANDEHVASWHPRVAVAVADWLDEEAKEHPDDDDFRYIQPGCRHALAIVHAYLAGDVS